MTSEEKGRSDDSRVPAADGVDRSAIRRMLKLSFAERARLAVEEARNLQRFDEQIRRR